jgi:alpha-amylase
MKGIAGSSGRPPLDPRANVPIRQRPWQDETIYMVLTDRFHNGDRTNDAGADPSDPNRFHGGDWQGIIDKLDYLKGTGATALWISPVQEQVRDFFGMDGYHGYWARDFYKTEPSFGSLDKLRELVDKAHERGMKVMVDLALNHTGYGAPMATDPAYHDWFHHVGNIKFLSRWWMEHGELHGLPDFAQEKPKVARWLIDMSKWWIDQTGIDGFRLDAVRHVPLKFWKQFSSEIHQHAGDNFMLLGEIYDYSTKRTSVWAGPGKLDSVFDFPLNTALRNSVGSNETYGLWKNVKYFVTHIWTHGGEAIRRIKGQGDGDMRRISKVLQKDERYAQPELLVTMLDNHDMPRFLSAAGPNGEQKLKLAMDLLFTLRGIPSVYYGTETGMTGFEPHESRSDMNFDSSPHLREHFSKLAAVRAGSEALRRGDYRELSVDRAVLAFARRSPSQLAIVVANNADTAQRRTVRLGDVAPAGTVLRDARSGETLQPRDGKLEVEVGPRQSLILLS